VGGVEGLTLSLFLCFLLTFFFFFLLFPKRKQHPRATGADVVDGSLVNKECEVPKVKEEVVQVF
jgi:hypothetical protein